MKFIGRGAWLRRESDISQISLERSYQWHLTQQLTKEKMEGYNAKKDLKKHFYNGLSSEHLYDTLQSN